jgi:hypothetical protein
MHFVFDAFQKSGTFPQYGFESLLLWEKILKEHPTSLKESWEWGDYSHAWSGTPTFQLSSKILGVTPAVPGFGIINIYPEIGELQWAKGTVPTHFGLVKLHIEQFEKIIKLELSLPSGTTGILKIPQTKNKLISITEKGCTIWSQFRFYDLNSRNALCLNNEQGSPHLILQAGYYRFEFQYSSGQSN